MSSEQEVEGILAGAVLPTWPDCGSEFDFSYSNTASERYVAPRLARRVLSARWLSSDRADQLLPHMQHDVASRFYHAGIGFPFGSGFKNHLSGGGFKFGMAPRDLSEAWVERRGVPRWRTRTPEWRNEWPKKHYDNADVGYCDMADDCRSCRWCGEAS